VKLGEAQLARLRAALAEAGESAEFAAERATLLLAGFAVPHESDYDALEAFAAAAREFPGTW
jgi:hypothetical protein